MVIWWMILGCMLNDSWLMLGRYSFSLLIFVHFQQRILFEKTAFSWGFSGSLQKWTPSLNREHATLVGKRLPPLLKSSMLLKFNFLGNNQKNEATTHKQSYFLYVDLLGKKVTTARTSQKVPGFCWISPSDVLGNRCSSSIPTKVQLLAPFCLGTS